MSARPWSKWFWNDWRGDPGLRLCSLAARGLWMDMLCIAAESDPLGYVSINGQPLDATGLARLTGAPVDEVQPLLDELHRNGVFSIDRHGRIYNRRMVRDAKASVTGRQNGKKGGNPRLLQHIEVVDEKLDGLTPKPTPISHMPEPEPEKEGEAIASFVPIETHPVRTVAESMIAVWVEECGDLLGKPEKLTRPRLSTCNARWSDTFGKDIQRWREYCRRIRAAPWLIGAEGGTWRADFDWVLKPVNLTKITEGKYDPKPIRQAGLFGARQRPDIAHGLDVLARAAGMAGEVASARPGPGSGVGNPPTIDGDATRLDPSDPEGAGGRDRPLGCAARYAG